MCVCLSISDCRPTEGPEAPTIHTQAERVHAKCKAEAATAELCLSALIQYASVSKCKFHELLTSFAVVLTATVTPSAPDTPG